MNDERNEYEAKLAALRAKLQESIESPLIEDFDPEAFLQEMKERYTHDS
ncbi:MAG: type II toxin-antitoxin system ParD family antitoxin [Candidatus Thiodiazotropha sp. (ex Lucinoma kastoroae)]|nr:type II toxin-antitoxin system ParD family antitoxin [Candidatus Thiodiazotropha sp. (ex Lucinoma kastoroae)]